MVRWTLYKLKTEDILNNEYSNKALLIDGKRIHKARILGNIKNINENNSMVSFEIDGLSIRDFNKKVSSIEEGDLLDIFGRISEYDGVRFISLEGYRKITENKEKWIELRNLEIEKTRKYIEDEGENEEYQSEGENSSYSSAEEEVLEDIYDEEDLKDSVLDIIKNSNEPIPYDKLVDLVEISEEELDEILEQLKDDAEIYEPSTGYYKDL